MYLLVKRSRYYLLVAKVADFRTAGGLNLNTDRWLSVIEIATHLGVSKETVYRWLEQQKIPGHKIGRLWKFRASEVDAWVIDGGATEIPDELPNMKIFESSTLMESETT